MKEKTKLSDSVDKIPIDLYNLIKKRKANSVEWGGIILRIICINSQEQLEVEQGIIKHLLYHPIPTLNVFMYAPEEINLPEPESV